MHRIAGIAALLLCAPAWAAPPSIESVNVNGGRDWRNRDFTQRGGGAIAQYEKLELEVELTATFDNPFDPEQVDLSAEFTSPAGQTFHVWGFFDPGSSEWRVRFAPTEAGAWRYTVLLRDREGKAANEPGEFRCVASSHPGFVTIAANRRYLQHSDGSSFYGVGLWYNDSYGGGGNGAITEESLDELQRLGVNFVSFYPPLLETWTTGLGRYDSSRIARLDQIFQWCEARDIHISWNLVFHSNISEAVWGEGNSEYRDNPYRSVAPAKEFFASEEAWKYQQKLYRYIIARWGASRALFLWFVIDEINGTEGWTEGNREAAHDWCRRMNKFFHENDPYGRPTTGTQSGGVDQWWPEGYEIFDIAGREIYEAQGHPMPTGKPDLVNAHPLRASYRNYAKQTAALWSGFEKPAIIAETGFDHTYYEPGMPGYLATYHNALWATLANGGAATPFWWSYSPYINEGVVTSQIRSFANFVRDIDFAGKSWAPQAVEISGGDAWGMRADNLAFGWAANPTNGIAKETLTVEGLPAGEYDVHLYRTWRGIYMPPIPVDAPEGTLTFAVPELTPVDGRGKNLGDDVAFKITPRGEYRPFGFGRGRR